MHLGVLRVDRGRGGLRGCHGSHRSTGLSLRSASVDDDDDAVNVCCL